MDTSSPSDNDMLGAVPFVTNIDLGIPLHIPPIELPPAEPEVLRSELLVSPEPVLDATEESPEFNIATETLTATDPPSHAEPDIRFAPDSTEPTKADSENLEAEHPIDESPVPEAVGPIDAQEEATEETEPTVMVSQDEREEEGMGLKLRWSVQDSSLYRVSYI